VLNHSWRNDAADDQTGGDALERLDDELQKAFVPALKFLDRFGVCVEQFTCALIPGPCVAVTVLWEPRLSNSEPLPDRTLLYFQGPGDVSRPSSLKTDLLPVHPVEIPSLGHLTPRSDHSKSADGNNCTNPLLLEI